MKGCVAGIDDGYFKRGWRKTTFVLAAHCWRNNALCPCLVLGDFVEIDGMDSTDKAISLVKRALRELDGLEAVLLDTVIFAGFNILDARRLNEETSVPVIPVFWYEPDRDAVRRAITKHFDDAEQRLKLLEETWSRLTRIVCSKGSLLIAPYGLSTDKAWELVCSLQIYTRQPEPLFTAHVMASRLSSIFLGENKQ
ncbi:DUF99 family protein [Pyrofollis japonicus]|uniref:endonuclease dU n=1 Tax=Pyrofollis japonicus TaxID=3060460 RepID=UPI00295B8068|nr:DUF99 family protein [Pyrofollis japonicus]BEP18308.1 DUF99 family protein [Pyrofollis japonicus]